MSIKKNLILCFSSIQPAGFTAEQIVSREKNYELSLDWILKSIPNNWEIIYNDNTLNSLDEIVNERLKNKLKNLNVILHKKNEGISNKGAGEHDMCKTSFSTISSCEYNWIAYFTARHIVPNSWYFDNLEQKYNDYESVMSNSVFYFLNNYLRLNSAEESYNDMLFAMKSNVFAKFVDSINIQELKDKNKNSETHLYEFIKNNKIKTVELENLGILRNDSKLGWHLV